MITLITLTKKGRMVCRNWQAPKTTEYRILFFLDKNGMVTKDRIVSYCCDGDEAEANRAILKLRSAGLLEKDKGDEVSYI